MKFGISFANVGTFVKGKGAARLAQAARRPGSTRCGRWSTSSTRRATSPPTRTRPTGRCPVRATTRYPTRWSGSATRPRSLQHQAGHRHLAASRASSAHLRQGGGHARRSVGRPGDARGGHRLAARGVRRARCALGAQGSPHRGVHGGHAPGVGRGRCDLRRRVRVVPPGQLQSQAGSGTGPDPHRWAQRGGGPPGRARRRRSVPGRRRHGAPARHGPQHCRRLRARSGRPGDVGPCISGCSATIRRRRSRRPSRGAWSG